MTSNQKKALKAEHTNRLKNAFVKALQQEQVSTSTPKNCFTGFLQCWLHFLKLLLPVFTSLSGYAKCFKAPHVS